MKPPILVISDPQFHAGHSVRRERIDMVGFSASRLTVVSFAGLNSKNEAMWNCSCECGGDKIVNGYHIRKGTIQSCGCLRREVSTARSTRHGGRQTRLYRIWCAMKARCNNPATFGYRWYGAKGVRVCNEWLESFAAFRTWALSNGYKGGLTIDRKETDGNYEPDNCHWITQGENSRRRNEAANIGH